MFIILTMYMLMCKVYFLSPSRKANNHYQSLLIK